MRICSNIQTEDKLEGESLRLKPGLISDLLKIAKKTSCESARLLKSSEAAMRNLLAVESDGRELKLEADRLINAEIVSKLRVTGIPILSEEQEQDAEIKAGSLMWIIDPLDGSVNYMRGISLCAVSIALWNENAPVFGVVYDFNEDRVITGCHHNSTNLITGNGDGVADTEKLNQAILCTGFPSRSRFGDESLSRFILQVQSFQKIRMFGSAVQSLISVACGKVDTYFEEDIMLWDVAAGLAIVEAAGGKWCMTQGRLNHSRNVIASCPGVFDDAVLLLKGRN